MGNPFMTYVLCNADTDSVSIRKPDNSFFTLEERSLFLQKLNEQFPEFINFADDGYFSSFIVLKAKNYIMLDDKGKLTLKGSSLKSSTLEPILKQFLKEIIDSMLAEREDFLDIYLKYVRMASDIKDIRPWCSKKTISDTTLTGPGTTQVKMRAAIAGTEYVEGDKIYLFFKNDESLCLVENFDGDYDKDVMYKKLYDATSRFSGVINGDVFVNYSLKRSKKELDQWLSMYKEKVNG